MPEQAPQRDATTRRYWPFATAALAIVAAVLAASWPVDQPEPSRRSTLAPQRDPAKPTNATGTNAPAAGIPNLPTALPALAGQPNKPNALAPVPVEEYIKLLPEVTCVCRAREAAEAAAELVACRATMRFIHREEDEATLLAVAAGRMAYDPDAAAQCLADLRQCSAGDPAGICDRVYRGLVGLGGECHFRDECADGTCSMHAPRPTPGSGTCKATPKIGARCAGILDCVGGREGLDCIDGTCRLLPRQVGEACSLVCLGDNMWCDTGAEPHVCKPKLAKDAPCSPDANPQCGDGLTCVEAGHDFRCRAPTAAGKPQVCDPTKAPFSGCPFGKACVATPAGGQCLDKVDDGERCFGDAQCHFPKSYCADRVGPQPGRCIRLPVAGEPCAPHLVEDCRCRIPFVCDPIRNICVDQLAEGAACEGYLCEVALRPSVVCVHGVCRRPQPEGAACEPDPEVATGEGVLSCARGLKCIAGHCAAK